MSVTEAPVAAFSRWHESEINRPRDDVGAIATLAGASDCLPHQDCGGGGAAPSPKFQRSMPPAIGAESCGHSYKPNGRRRATTKVRPRADRRRRQKPNAPSCGPVCPTPCRSAASPPHERFVDVTPISLRRDRPLQRLVSQHPALFEHGHRGRGAKSVRSW